MLFTDFSDNTLAREELHALTDHLLGCPGCSQEWREFQQTLTLVHSIETQPAPADLLPGIHEKLAQKGIFNRIWSLVETLNFSLSIPAAAAIFTIAMLAGFLLKTSPMEQAGIFQSPATQVSALPQGGILRDRRPPLVPNAMFPLSHNGGNIGGNFAPVTLRALATHPTRDNDSFRLLSPDIHVLVENLDHDSQIALFQEMEHQNWQLHRINSNLYLVHLPQTDMENFRILLGRHHFAMVPAPGAKSSFGNDKKILTAAIRFQ